MEIKLKTRPADENKRTIRDEHWALWQYSAFKSLHGIFPATTKGLDGEDIHAFYKNGVLFMVNWSDARNYFNSCAAASSHGSCATREFSGEFVPLIP